MSNKLIDIKGLEAFYIQVLKDLKLYARYDGTTPSDPAVPADEVLTISYSGPTPGPYSGASGYQFDLTNNTSNDMDVYLVAIGSMEPTIEGSGMEPEIGLLGPSFNNYSCTVAAKQTFSFHTEMIDSRIASGRDYTGWYVFKSIESDGTETLFKIEIK